MSSPSPLTPEERALKMALLRHGRAERPSDTARRRTLAAAVALAAGAPTKAAATALLLRLISLGKWLGVGSLVLAGGLGVRLALRGAPAETPQAAALAAPFAPRPADRPSAPAPESSGEAAPEAPPAPPPDASEARPAPPPSQAREAAPARASLGEEMAVIEGARRALAGGDAAGALAALDAYQKQFPSGRFGQEAAFLRIEAMTRRGQRAAATALARRFLAAYKKSPLAPRVRAMAGLSAEAP